MTVLKFTGELTYIGPAGSCPQRRLPLLTVPWLEDKPAVLMEHARQLPAIRIARKSLRIGVADGSVGHLRSKRQMTLQLLWISRPFP